MDTKYNAITEFDKVKLAYLLNDIKMHTESYPKYHQEWMDWLDENVKNKKNLFDVLPR